MEERKKRRRGSTKKRKKDYKYTKYKIAAFSVCVMLIALIGLMFPLRPKESKLEKRVLTRFPSFSVESFLNGEFFNGVSTWYADTFPFREQLLAGNTKFRSLYGIQNNQIYGSMEKTDNIPKERIKLTDILLPSTKMRMEDLDNEIKAAIETQRAADAANGGAKRREITKVPEQVGTVYVSGDTAFSLYGFTENAANAYIDAISALANKVEDDVHIYDIVVPISSGIYLY